MTRRVIPARDLIRYAQLRPTMSRAAAARETGISYGKASRIDHGEMGSTPHYKKIESTVHQAAELEALAPKTWDELESPAKYGLENFAFWRKRYLGRLSTPWQEDAAYKVIEWLATEDKEYVVVNAPPGSGKSTLFTHDIPAWLACRDRSIRCLIGSRTERQAKQYVSRLRRTFDRRRPIQADPNEVALGLATDAIATLIDDYGRFKPLIPDLWRNDEFVLAQLDDQLLEDKEPSFAAYGMDSGFLGSRANLVIWDDLADKTTMRTQEAREGIRQWWDDEAETRLEPGGVLVLQGQRMGPEDIYRHALDQRLGEDDDDDVTGEVEDDRPMKYRHIVYRAHDETKCLEEHGKESPYWPDGCLLDPRRLPWSGSGGLRTIRSNREDKYRVLYQQEDLDPASVLVNPIWITGGLGVDGVQYPGCRDKDRGICQLPKGLAGRLLSIATADPSPTKFWGVHWWIVRIDDDGPQERYLMDLLKETLDAPDFLDWNQTSNSWTGVMEEWQLRSQEMGLPITTWIVEANAAQRFLLQYEHVKRWTAKRGVTVRAHQTHRNKADADFGVETIAPHYRYGRVRLPWGDAPGRLACMKLTEEVTRWPEGRSDDQVMAHWFLEWTLPTLWTPGGAQPRARRPSWLRREPSLVGL